MSRFLVSILISLIALCGTSLALYQFLIPKPIVETTEAPSRGQPNPKTESYIVVAPGTSSHGPDCDRTGMKPYSVAGSLLEYIPCSEMEILNSSGLHFYPLEAFSPKVQGNLLSKSEVIQLKEIPQR